jgi:hypothetical protein
LIGLSWEGRPINAYALGTGSLAVAIIGGMHGAPEANSSWLVWELLHYYERTPEAIPPQLSLVFVPEANPDGMANDMRELVDGVDPNRNWPTPDWSPTSYGPGGTLLPNGGGPEPLSEPETAALAAWILQVQPAVVVSYHSAGGLVMGDSIAIGAGLVDAYLAGARGYVYREWIYYPVTGDFAQWLDGLGIPTIEVELWDHADPDVERNLTAVQNVLIAIESILATDPSY